MACPGIAASLPDIPNPVGGGELSHAAQTAQQNTIRIGNVTNLKELIRQIEAMQDRTSRNQERIRQIVNHAKAKFGNEFI